MSSPLANVVSTLTAAHLIPDVLPPSFVPTHLLSLLYPSAEVLLGNALAPADAADEPLVSFAPLGVPAATADAGGEQREGDGEGDVAYTLAMVDPDAPTRANPEFRSFRHWVVTGLKPPASTTASAAALKTQAALTPYRAPAPRPASGVHRYTFLLFQEPAGKPLDIPVDAPERSNALEGRRSWDALAFAARYGLTLVGVNFFTVHAEA